MDVGAVHNCSFWLFWQIGTVFISLWNNTLWTHGSMCSPHYRLLQYCTETVVWVVLADLHQIHEGLAAGCPPLSIHWYTRWSPQSTLPTLHIWRPCFHLYDLICYPCWRVFACTSFASNRPRLQAVIPCLVFGTIGSRLHAKGSRFIFRLVMLMHFGVAVVSGLIYWGQADYVCLSRLKKTKKTYMSLSLFHEENGSCMFWNSHLASCRLVCYEKIIWWIIKTCQVVPLPIVETFCILLFVLWSTF